MAMPSFFLNQKPYLKLSKYPGMKNHVLLAVIIIALGSSCRQESVPVPSQAFQERMENKLYPNEGYYRDKNYPFETFGLQKYRTGLRQAALEKDNNRAGAWTQQGPGNLGGRVNTIAVHPTDPNTIMIGYSIGGIHKTVNGGASWYPVFDDKVTLSLSDIAYDPADPQIVYAGTGDLNISGYPVTGNGIYKSTDGGETWEQSGLSEAGIISEIYVSRQNSNIIYAASMGIPVTTNEDRGMYKSVDGGQTWEQVLFISTTTGIIDIEVHPEDDNIIYAAAWSRVSSYSLNVIGSAISRILKSTDGGETWDYLLEDLPSGTLVRPALAMYEGDPDVLYVQFNRFIGAEEDRECTDGYYIESIHKTTNGGDSWQPLDLSPETGWRCGFVGGFSWYFGKMRVNPNDPDDLFVLGVDLLRTRDGGLTWEEAAPPWWQYEVHADKHDLVFSGSDILLATDGGAYRSPAIFEDWEDIEDIVSTQFYRVAYNPHTPELFYGGAQDNGSTGGSKDDINGWPRIFGGDGFQMAFDPTDSLTYYAETQRGRIWKIGEDEFFGSYSDLITDSLSDEGAVNWDMPYFLDAVDPDIVYCGREKVWKMIDADQYIWEAISPVLVDDQGATIATSHTISALAQSTVVPDVFVVGTSDGYLWRTVDGGENWDKAGANMPERYYSDVRPSPNDAARVYASITGYEDNDNTPYLYMSVDTGLTYVSISGDLPQIAVNDIFVPPGQTDENTIVVGTDAGVYATTDLGLSWYRLGNNMPVMPIYDLAYNPSTEELMAGSHARGIWTIPIEELLTVSTKETVAALQVTVYPTLVQTDLYVSGKEDSYRYQVYDLQGKLQLQGRTLTEQSIGMEDLSAGMYVILLQTADGRSVSKKLVKQ